MKLVWQRCSAQAGNGICIIGQLSWSPSFALLLQPQALVLTSKMAETEVRQQLQRLQVEAGRGMFA